MKRLTIILIFILMAGAVAGQHDSTRIAQISLAYPIGSAGIQSVFYANNFSLNMTYGLNGGVKGAELGGALNFNKGDVKGLQASGALNINTGEGAGALLAGAVNINLGPMQGLMASGAYNQAKGLKGLQLAGFANISEEKVEGAQIAGAANVAGDVKGLQLSGFINIAKTVKGVQLAPVINIADTSDYAIGLINIVKSGEKKLGTSIDETGTHLLTFRSGGRVMYSILGVGYNYRNDDAVFATEAGFGAKLIEANHLRLYTEGVAINLADLSDYENENYFRASFRLLPAFNLGMLEVFGGPTLNYVRTDLGEGEELINIYLWDKVKNEHLNGLYIGAMGGINFIF